MTSPTTRALKVSSHWACIAGPDIGAVIPVGEPIGRSCSVLLTDPHTSRCHAQSQTDARGQVWLSDHQSVNGIAIRTRWGMWRSPTSQGPHRIRIGQHIRVGSNVFELRPRPRALVWPVPEQSHSRRWMSVISIGVMALFLIWRLQRILAIPSGVLVGVCCACAAAVGAFCVFRWHLTRRRWRCVDASFLALILAVSTVDHSGAPKPGGIYIWPERPNGYRHGARRGVFQLVGPSPSGSSPGAPLNATAIFRRMDIPRVQRMGFLGPHASLAARWWAAQCAARCGGGRVIDEDGACWSVGTGTEVVHISAVEDCPWCAPKDARHTGDNGQRSTDLIHIGIGRSFHELPSWCDRVVTAERPCVSLTWWLACATPMSDHTNTPALPREIVWDRVDVMRDHAPAVGVDAHGFVTLDLERDGPHALIAGSTGSGKSQALITWLLSMCMAESPHDLRLVLIDYKGGATFKQLADLPHTECVLTDLDPRLTDRALRGLQALLRRREQLFNDVGVSDRAQWVREFTANPSGPTGPPPPRIVVVIDEFRVLKDEHPDSMNTLMRLAAQGRSLGLHLIAATQRPSGAIDASMRANIDLRIALRCVSATDSLDILSDARAHQLPKIPGRALLVGSHGLSELQFAFLPNVRSIVDAIRAQNNCGGLLDVPRSHNTPGSQTQDDALPKDSPGSRSQAVSASQRSPSWQSPDVSLWPQEIPADVTWEQADSLCAPQASQSDRTSPILAIADGVDQGMHRPLVWDGPALHFYMPSGSQIRARRWVQSAAVRLASARKLPLHLCSDCPEIPAVSHVSTLNIEDFALLIEHIHVHGPAVLAIDDLDAFLDALSTRIGLTHAQALWSTLQQRAESRGIIIIGARLSQNRSHGVRVSQRTWTIFQPTSRSDVYAFGLQTRLPLPSRECDVWVCSPGSVTPIEATIPLGIPDSPSSAHLTSELSDSWRVRKLDRHQRNIALIGADWHPYVPTSPCDWIILTDQTHISTEWITQLHDAAGWDQARIDILATSAWSRLPLSPTLRLVALDPPVDVARALLRRCRSPSLALEAHMWDESTGFLIENGRCERLAVPLPTSPNNQ
ncbi:FtsK/SpoIIIE domain-containing protein [Schaalia sp. ZJ1691]|uniref:FtsK/SpoIIIE domain-containing protein n=1 Tax=Schaalia sp. ZJ1691 TaxID=2709404 RepID=UPI0013EE1A85|nr:FtsK/SpoIIIE domain-containing protein [Schaalia sp. ZJ1691]